MTTTSLPPLGAAGTQNPLGGNAGGFGENDFLRLLTEQLRNQTPLEPVDNESFMNQMASYSSMQQQMDLNHNLLALLDFQGLLARMQGLSQGSALLGKEVSYQDASGRTVSGTVDSVFVDDQGDVRLRLHDGSELSLRQVISIANPGDPAGAAGSPAPGTGDPTGAPATPPPPPPAS